MTRSNPIDGSCEAEYADGYIHSETDLGDVSLFPFERDGEIVCKNTFYDIVERLPEAEHGPMVRFTVFYNGRRADIPFNELPANARPIRFRHMEREMIVTGRTESDVSFTASNNRIIDEPILKSVDVGYQYTDENGKNHQEVMEL